VAGAQLELVVVDRPDQEVSVVVGADEPGGGGSVEVELLDEQEQPIQGYARNESQIINGNSVRMPVRWQQHEDVGELAGRPIRLRFYLRDCKLYSFQFRTEGATVAVAEPLR